MMKISSVETSCEEERPVLADFQNGVLNEGEDKHLKCRVFCCKSSKYCAVSNENLFYSGCVEDDDELYNTFMVVPTKKNKVKLVQVQHCTLTPAFDKKDKYDLDVRDTAEKSFYELNVQFGSKKAKRQTEQRQRMKMSIDSVKEKLEQTVTNISINESLLNSTQQDIDDDKIYPKINRNASRIDDVYILDDLIPEDILDSLEDAASEILESDLDEVPKLSSFVKHNLKSIQQSSSNADVKLRKCKILLYINYLIIFITKQAKELKKGVVLCEESMQVDQFIKDNFLIRSKSGWLRPLSIKDKCICHMLVLSILALDYKVNVAPLLPDIKIGAKKIIDVAKILALSQLPTDKQTVILKLPLPPPVSPIKKRKSR